LYEYIILLSLFDHSAHSLDRWY